MVRAHPTVPPHSRRKSIHPCEVCAFRRSRSAGKSRSTFQTAYRCRRPACPGDPVFQRRQCLIETPLEYWMPRLKRGHDNVIRVRLPAARSRPSCASVSLPLTSEGAGKAGCRPHPWPASNKKSWRQLPQVWPNIRPSLRNGVTAYSALSPGTGLSCPRRSRASSAQELGLSVGRSGPHAFAVRADDARLASSSRPSHPALHVRDDA